MAKYLIQVSYTAEGMRGVVKEGGSSRRTMVEQMTEGLGAPSRPSTSPSGPATSS